MAQEKEERLVVCCWLFSLENNFQVMLCFDSMEDLPSFTQQNGHPSRYIIAFFETPRHGFETSTLWPGCDSSFPGFYPQNQWSLRAPFC